MLTTCQTEIYIYKVKSYVTYFFKILTLRLCKLIRAKDTVITLTKNMIKVLEYEGSKIQKVANEKRTQRKKTTGHRH